MTNEHLEYDPTKPHPDRNKPYSLVPYVIPFPKRLRVLSIGFLVFSIFLLTAVITIGARVEWDLIQTIEWRGNRGGTVDIWAGIPMLFMTILSSVIFVLGVKQFKRAKFGIAWHEADSEERKALLATLKNA